MEIGLEPGGLLTLGLGMARPLLGDRPGCCGFRKVGQPLLAQQLCNPVDPHARRQAFAKFEFEVPGDHLVALYGQHEAKSLTGPRRDHRVVDMEVRCTLAQPLPRPGRYDDLDRLRDLLGISDDATFQLIITLCVAALMPNGPYPLIAIGGEQGAGKTLLAGVLHAVDPSKLPLRALPRSERDLYISCANAHVLGFDTISKMSDWLSDAFCKVATGGGMALR